MKKIMTTLLLAIFSVIVLLPTTSHAKLADGVYSIPYQVNAAGKTSASVGNDYFLKPAKLTVKDGKMVVEATVKNAAWVVKLEPPGYKVLKEDKANDTRTFEFTVTDLSKALPVAMRIEIPNLEYYHSYTVDFIFDEAKATKTADVAGNKPTTPAATTPTTTKPVTSASAAVAQQQANQTVAKPTTSSIVSKPTTTTTASTTKVKNPQTSDNIPYIALFLLCASAFMIVRLRKQTA